MTTILDGKSLSQTLRQEIAEEVAFFVAQTGITPCLAAILVGEDPASQVYVRNKERACANVGMKSVLFRLPAETTSEELLTLVEKLNHDATVHGILVQLPLPPQIDEKTILDAISPDKDVDAFHPANVGLILQGRPRFLPCTPFGIQEMLRRYGIETAGKHVVILGRSDIVGKPMGAMMVQRSQGADATVTICHSKTANLPAVTRLADILIVAIGRPRFVTAEMVKPGAVVVDVGINRTEEGLVGDVDFEAVKEVASAITPVPGGVGPLTITMLLGNTLKAARGI
ncbi:MAG: bifunctional methylenetetrahydrofolate dehydrogenase/methenyltetrahydrofolate cyclohydrolase FolD [Planctomycetia bacterium]|nr:bifunctional methylenetetrahydrofolate dehydrogenase/methenyltetrahydrofolate cyclohydrolase FolD [Planctomycetia bacterium]